MGVNTKKAGSKKQYTIRNIPRSVDQALRKKAQIQQKSLNAVILDLLFKEAGVSPEPRTHEDLDHLIGSWVHDPTTEKALVEQRKIDPKDWE